MWAKTLLQTSVVLSVVALTSAQTATQPVLRHLEFSFTYHTTYTSQSASYYGTSSGMATDGGNGTIVVDVIAAAKDGGLVIRTHYVEKNANRAFADVTCAVYGDGRVVCPEHSDLQEPTDVLLSFLGRGFFDPSDKSKGSTWSQNLGADYSVTTTYTLESAPDVNPVQISEKQNVKATRAIAQGSYTNGTIVYDVAMSVPDAIHEDHVSKPRLGNGVTDMSTVDIKLVSDSFAKH